MPAKCALSGKTMPLCLTISPKLPLLLVSKAIPEKSHSDHLVFNVRRGRLKISIVPAHWVHSLILYDNCLMKIPIRMCIDEVMEEEEGTHRLTVNIPTPQPVSSGD